MDYNKITKEQLLIELDNKTEAIINMGKQLSAISTNMETFDFLLIAA